jgi:hypothetical protein
MSQPALEDAHEWFSFEDPDEDRTWVFDVTFLLSNWSCIYGRGCQGILTGPAPELMTGCCTHGAHLTDNEDLESVGKAVQRLTNATWQYRKRGLSKGWFELTEDKEMTTTTFKDACIFLNRPGFAGGVGCAFHVAATQAGERPMDWKPDVCWQLPLRIDSHTDAYGHVTSMVREWKRRDWGGGGFEFHWWCTDGPEAFVGSDPVYVYLRDELTELVGATAYGLLAAELKRRARRTVLPHPAVRR